MGGSEFKVILCYNRAFKASFKASLNCVKPCTKEGGG